MAEDAVKTSQITNRTGDDRSLCNGIGRISVLRRSYTVGPDRVRRFESRRGQRTKVVLVLGAIDAIEAETAERDRIERERDREVGESEVFRNLRIERCGIGVLGKMHECEQKSADQDSHARDGLQDEGVGGKE